MLHLLHHLPLILPLVGWSASSSSQQSQQKTLTTSGAASPNVTDTGTAATTGSIAVGAGGKYQEAGAVDLSGAKDVGGQVGTISAGTGANITIGDPNADALISQLADQFSSAVQGVSASAATGLQAASSALNQPVPGTNGSISYKTLGLILAGIGALVALIALFKHKS